MATSLALPGPVLAVCARLYRAHQRQGFAPERPCLLCGGVAWSAVCDPCTAEACLAGAGNDNGEERGR